jgi:hypothetical protein
MATDQGIHKNCRRTVIERNLGTNELKRKQMQKQNSNWQYFHSRQPLPGAQLIAIAMWSQIGTNSKILFSHSK